MSTVLIADLVHIIEGWESHMDDARRRATECRNRYDVHGEAKWEAFAQGLEECSICLREKIKPSP